MRRTLWLAAVFALAGMPALAASTSTSALPETTTLSGTDLLQATIGDDAGGWQTRKITVENAADPLKAAMGLGSAAQMDVGDFLRPENNLGDLADPAAAREALGFTPIGQAVARAADQTEAFRALEIWYDLFAFADFAIDSPLAAGDVFTAGDDGAACAYTIVGGTPATDREIQAGGTSIVDRIRIRDAINANPQCGLEAMYAPGGPSDRISLSARIAGGRLRRGRPAAAGRPV